MCKKQNTIESLENSHKMDPYFAADLHWMISEIASDIFNSQVGVNIA